MDKAGAVVSGFDVVKVGLLVDAIRLRAHSTDAKYCGAQRIFPTVKLHVLSTSKRFIDNDVEHLSKS